MNEYELKKLSDLKKYTNNSRTHSREQIKKVAASISTFGFVSPIIINGENTIVAGHCRYEAAVMLGIDSVPVIVTDLQGDDLKAYVIADNRLAMDSGWDFDILKHEIESIDAEGFDFDVLGFSSEELGEIFCNPVELGFDDANDDCANIAFKVEVVSDMTVEEALNAITASLCSKNFKVSAFNE